MKKSTISALVFMICFTFLVIGCKQETVFSFEAKNENGVMLLSETDCDYVDIGNGNIQYKKDGIEYIRQFEDKKIEIQKTQREKFIVLPDSKYSTIAMIAAAITGIIGFFCFIVLETAEYLAEALIKSNI